tara:strand:- start:836 stop:1546 length:711 start_codon:yes stop_codon:yes gene_type:complete
MIDKERLTTILDSTHKRDKTEKLEAFSKILDPKLKTVVESIFPTPVYRAIMDREFTKEELDFVNNEKNKCTKNQGNINTKDNYILNREEFKNIKSFLNECCKDYLEKIICPKYNTKLNITQSWLNYTEKDQYHHQHAHPNSVVSGVLYFNGDKQDKILLHSTKGYEPIIVEKEKFNQWNSATWWFPAEIGELIMFPSSTFHQVEVKQGETTRISLSFNSFYKGALGSDIGLTGLII